jgi:metallo-beta-lactamase class B
MIRSPLRLFACCCLLLLLPLQTHAQPEGWTRPFSGFRVIGDLYGVGTWDLGMFLITSEEGHILINTGLEGSTGVIRRNMEPLGFRMEDIEILLQMQAHYDHAAALAEIKEISGAELWATAGDVPLLEDGGAQ